MAQFSLPAWASILGCGTLLVFAGPVQADRGHSYGTRHSHGHSHSLHSHSHHSHSHGSYRGSLYKPYSPFSVGVGVYPRYKDLSHHYAYPRYVKPHAYRYDYFYPSYYSGYYPRYQDYSDIQYTVRSYEPPVTKVATTPLAPAIARLQVLVPDADAEVWVEGHKTSSRGATRNFESPELRPGKDFTYDVKASWKQDGKTVTEERQVSVSAGGFFVVDFRPRGEPVPAPSK